MNPSPIQSPPDRRTVQAPKAGPAAATLQLADLAYLLFRHKGKILACALAGLAAAAAFWYGGKVTYVSGAKLLVRYVIDSRTVGPLDGGDQMRSPDSRGDNIISSEVELLSSLDLAQEVASNVGPASVLASLGGGDSLPAATQVVQEGLAITVKPKSNVIEVAFRHPDPAVARNVVTNLVANYLRLHARVHRPIESLDDWRSQADKQRTAVATTEADLRALKGEDAVSSLVEAKTGLTSRITSLEAELSDAVVKLAESRATFGGSTNRPAEVPAGPIATNLVGAGAPPQVVAPLVSAEARRAYQSVLDRLEALRRRQQELLLVFNPASSYVRPVSDQIAATELQRDGLMAATPGLTNAPAPATVSASPAATGLEAAWTKAITAEARLRALTNELGKARSQARRLADKEPEIAQLERKLRLDEKQYEYFSSAMERARVDEALAATQLANIAIIQGASPGYRDMGKRPKIAAGLAGGGLALGLGLAFLIEFFTDSSVRRPGQVTSQLRLPLFLSIPRLAALARGARSTGTAEAEPQAAGAAGAELTSYSEALRDRLIMYFQAKELHRKPKLIGVTSFGRGAGVTSIATSLAATLSETGEGNVLYVDVNPDQGPSAHPFRQGKPVVGIQEALTEGTRDSAQVQENLYVVSLSDPSAKRVGILPRTLASLVPQIKTSGYDYIIFDLPPVTQTSITNRVAGLLDINVVVLESEKTNCGLARQAAGLLAESNAQMVAVLNKHRRYLPRKIDADL